MKAKRKIPEVERAFNSNKYRIISDFDDLRGVERYYQENLRRLN